MARLVGVRMRRVGDSSSAGAAARCWHVAAVLMIAAPEWSMIGAPCAYAGASEHIRPRMGTDESNSMVGVHRRIPNG